MHQRWLQQCQEAQSEWQLIPEAACMTIRDDLSHRLGSSELMTPTHFYLLTALHKQISPLLRLYWNVLWKRCVGKKSRRELWVIEPMNGRAICLCPVVLTEEHGAKTSLWSALLGGFTGMAAVFLVSRYDCVESVRLGGFMSAPLNVRWEFTLCKEQSRV